MTRLLRPVVLALAFLSVSGAAAAAQTATVPFTFIDNRIVVSVRVNGHGPYAFVVDTGGSNVISTELARSLGLTLEAAGTGDGAGSKRAALARTSIATLTLGSLTFHHLAATAIDLREIARGIGFKRFDGVIGYDILRNYHTLFDMDAARLTFSSQPMPVPAGAKSIPFTLSDGLIHVAANLDGVAGTVVVDTGDRSSLTIFRGFANAHGFYTRYSALRSMLTGYGIGGPIYGDVFRLPHLGIFDSSVANVITRASRDKAGVFATGTEAGSIGGGVLRHFNIVYDYSQRRLTVWPSRAFAVRDTYDTTGMWLAAGSVGPQIVAVRPGGPAALAGLHVGDRIIAIHGASVRSRSVPELRHWFDTQPDGARVALTIGHPGRGSDVRTIVLHAAL
jgi:hypothetical protein